MDSTSPGKSFNLISVFKEKFLELSTHFLTTKHKIMTWQINEILLTTPQELPLQYSWQHLQYNPSYFEHEKTWLEHEKTWSLQAPY